MLLQFITMLKYLITISCYLSVVKSTLECGEFDLIVKEYVVCKGPKRINCIDGTVKILDNTNIQFNVDIKEDVKTARGKIVGTFNNQELLRLQVKNLCENVFLLPLIQNFFKMGSTCKFSKGHYLFSLDVEAASRKFYGGKFFYGNWTTKVLFFNDNCNMHCGIIHLILTPKKSPKNALQNINQELKN